jgi:hypothetical protein
MAQRKSRPLLIVRETWERKWYHRFMRDGGLEKYVYYDILQTPFLKEEESPWWILDFEPYEHGMTVRSNSSQDDVRRMRDPYFRMVFDGGSDRHCLWTIAGDKAYVRQGRAFEVFIYAHKAFKKKLLELNRALTNNTITEADVILKQGETL